MAEVSRNWIGWLAATALLLGAGGGATAQSGPETAQAGALSGRLTDLRSAPLAGVTVIAHNTATGAEARTITARNGAYHFAALAAGTYTLEAESGRLGRGSLDGIQVDAGHEARVQAAIAFEREKKAEPVWRAAVPTAAPASHFVQNASEPIWRAASPLLTETRPAAPALLAAEPFRQALPPARLLPPPPGPAPQTTPPVLTAFLAAEPLRTLLVTGRGLPALHAATPAMQGTAEHAAVAAVMLSALNLRPIAAAALRPELVSAAVTTTVSAAQLQALPVSGRQWQEFVLDTPAAAPEGSSEAAIRGAGGDPEDTTVDGASTRLAFGSAAGSRSGTAEAKLTGEGRSAEDGTETAWHGGHGMGVSEAAIRSVQTVAGNVEAAGSHAAGGRTSIETESGTNQLHGQGFFFDRQNSWGARNPFTQWVRNTGTMAAPSFTAAPYTPPDHEMVWGIGLGSRIRRNRLFWFAALDSYRRNDPAVSTVRNPGEFFETLEPTSPQIQLLSAQLNESQNQAYSDYLGISGSGYTAAGLEQLANLLGPAARLATQWTGFARLDGHVTERNRMTLEGTGSDWNAPGGGWTRVSESYGNHSFGASRASQQWLLARWEAFVTPNLLAVSQASAGRTIMTARPDTPSDFEQSLLSGNVWGQLPQIAVDTRYGFTIGNPARFGRGSYPDERLYHAQEMVNWVHGNLLLKAGMQLDHNTDAISLLRNGAGTYSYSSVQDFIADALAFEKFGLNPSGAKGNSIAYHGCNPAGNGLGALPCYSYYSQMMGPTHWHLSTTDWAGFTTAEWQLGKRIVVSAGLRWEREEMPPPIAGLANPELPQTAQLPVPGSEWGPRLSIAIGSGERHVPVVRLGYGMYYGRTENATLLTALTQTGSLNGDLYFFIRPTDGLNPLTVTSGAPQFPYVLAGQPTQVVKPGAVEFAPRFRNAEVHQAVASVEQELPGRVMLTESALLSLGRRLPVAIDTNFDPDVNPKTITYAVVDKTGAGPIKKNRITVPFYAAWPSATSPTGAAGRLNTNYQQIAEIMSRANSTYEAAMVRLNRSGRNGLNFHAHYTYAHAMDWNPNETTLVASSDVLDPANFSQEYGVSNLDVRHSATAFVLYATPWKLHNLAGRLANGWRLSGIGQMRSGLPYTMRTSGSLPREFDVAGNAITGLGPGMNGSGGDNRVYGVGRNTYRYPWAWKADLRLGKSFDLGNMRQLELLAESFNLFNHQNVTQLETTGYFLSSGSANSLPTLNFLSGLNNTAAFGKPLNVNATNYYRERQIQLGIRLRF